MHARSFVATSATRQDEILVSLLQYLGPGYSRIINWLVTVICGDPFTNNYVQRDGLAPFHDS